MDALSARADSKSVPNGFSMTTLARSIRLARCKVSMLDSAAVGGTLR